ncbi:MFS transporter [Luteipulveratus halotolerans]|uniref:Major facilitator superfamily (MFS) profile domain-containing protein n=1 Tax=Luteipulveratus halotolerans TaxID=1631356 RepID=A0A0L6CJK5_9MICO|nr:MFS transporter [Luteipulveratus halotolerans]KNX37800.1 hypothetical protein VV01_12605 [Luteipulveratus halotolerans]
MGAATVSPGKQLWAIKAWRYAFPAAVVSRLGDFVFDVTVMLWIVTDLARGESWAPGAASGVLIAAALPVLLVGPIAGVYADRVDRQRLLIRSNTVQAVAIGSLLLIPLLGDRTSRAVDLAWIFAAIVVTNGAGQFFNQARNTMIASTIPDELRTSAYSRQGSANSLIAIAGPPLAAPLYFAVGAEAALAVNALSFLVSSFLLSRFEWDSAPARAAAEQTFWASLRHGARAVAGNRLMAAVTFALTVVTFATGMINVLEVFFVTDVLHRRAELVGVLLMFFAIGTLCGTLTAPRLERRLGAPVIFASSFVLVGVGILAYSRTTSFPVAVAIFFLLAMPLGAANTVFMPMVMRSVPSELLGRTTVVLTVFPKVASLTSMAVTGWLVSTVMKDIDIDVAGTHLGPVDTVFVVSGLLMVATGVMVWRPLSASSPDSSDSTPAPQTEPDTAAGPGATAALQAAEEVVARRRTRTAS